MKLKIRVKVAMQPFRSEVKDFGYRSILIPVQNQKLSDDEMYNFLSIVAKESATKIYGVTTGLNDGIDLGSNNFRAITTPKVAMLVGDGVAGNDSGEIWHLFDQRFDMHLTRLDTRYFNRIDITKYRNRRVFLRKWSVLDIS